MAPVMNKRAVFAEIPTDGQDFPTAILYDTTPTIDPDTVPLNGGFLLKTVALSIDPYMRVRLRDSSIPGRFAAFTLGQPVFNFGIGRVVRSEFACVNPGEYVYHDEMPFQEYNIFQSLDKARIIKNEEGIPLEAYVGPVGMAGQTAYYGWKEYAHPQKGDTVFVSTGGGAVGSFVIQLAKAEGLKVIASAGTEEKIAFAKECGADVAFNYKTENTAEILQREGPINIYWDNVGGETLDAALGAAATGARFIECGMISSFSSPAPPAFKNIFMVVGKELKISGFIVSTLNDKYAEEFYDVVPKMIREGKLKYKLHRKTLKQVGNALLDVCTGKNNGKVTVVLE